MPLAIRSFFLALLALSVLSMTPAAAADSKSQAVTTADPTIPTEELDTILAPMTVDELTVEADGWLALVKKAAEQVAETKLAIIHQNKTRDAAEEKAEKAEETIEKAVKKAEDKTKGDVPDETKSQDKDEEKPPVKVEEKHAEVAKAEAVADQADKKKGTVLDQLTEIRAERTGLIDRLDIVLGRINQKLGLDDKGKEKPEVLKYRRYIDAVGGIKLDISDTESAIASISGWLMSKDGGLRWLVNLSTFVAIVVAFWFIAILLARTTRKALALGGNSSVLLTEFLVGMVRRIVVAIGIIVGLSALEVNIGPLLAVIGAAGFVVAFALQDTLSNFASGIMIMFYRPFDVDDFVEVAGIGGKVKSLNLVSTTITTVDNKRMVVPNNTIWGNIITNATGSMTRRVDMTFGIGYDDDIGKAKEVLEQIVADHPKVLDTPEPVIQLHELADSSVNFVCRPWTRTADYWSVYWDITREVKERFDKKGISIPYPQRDIHVYQEKTTSAKSDSHVDTEDTTRGADQMGLEQQGD
jgi:small conductance mechanosensitive channel